MGESAEATLAANKMAALARKTARDTEVDFAVEEKFSKVVCDGKLSSELAEAFKFTQGKLDGNLVWLCC